MDIILERLKDYSTIHKPRDSGEFAVMFKIIMPQFSKLSEYVVNKATEEEKKEIHNVLKYFVEILLTKLIIPNTDKFLQRYDMSLTSPETYITYMITTLSYFYGLVCYIKKEKEEKNKIVFKFIIENGCFGGSHDINKSIDTYSLSEIVQAIMCMSAKWQNVVLRDWWLSTEEGNERTNQLTNYLMKLLYRSMEILVLSDSTGKIIDYEPYRNYVNGNYECNVHMRRYVLCCLCRMLFICNFFSKQFQFSLYTPSIPQTEKEKTETINRIRNLLIDEAVGLLDMNGYVDKMRIEITNASLRIGNAEDFTATRNMQELIPASIVNISFLPEAQTHMVNVDDEALREYLVENRNMYDERNVNFLWYAVPRLHQLYMDNIYLQALESLFTKNNQSFPFRGECHLYEDNFFRHYQILSSPDNDRPIVFNMFDRMYVLFKGYIYFTQSVFDAIFIWANIVERYCSSVVLSISVRETLSIIQRGVISRQELSFDINYTNNNKRQKQMDEEKEEEEEEDKDKLYNDQIDFLKKCIWGKYYNELKKIN